MSKHTIKLMKYVDIVKELEAESTIKPGMLCERTSSDTVQAHSDQDGPVRPPMFALEDELQGKGIDDDYADGDRVQIWYPQAGEEVLGLLTDGENVAIGDELVSNGDGYLKKKETESGGELPDAVVAIALEACDRSGSSGEDDSMRIEIEIV